MAKVNFKALQVKTSLKGDNVVTIDGAADIANIIYTQGTGIVAHNLAHKIFESEGEVELSDKEADIVEHIVNLCCAPLHIDAIMSQLKTEK
jgi:hypothetical protein